MTNLTSLVKEYKKNKDNKILEKVFKLINKDIDKRVEIIYRKIKYYKIEKSDIKQELYIKILSIIENYNPNEPFENYFFSCLKYWKPKLSKEDVTHFESLYKIDEETGEEIEIDIEDKKQNTVDSNISVSEIFKECKNKLEHKICELYLKNPRITEEEIAKELNMTQQNISLIINKLRKRLKNRLK